MTIELPKWYAIHTRSNYEKKVFDGFCAKSIETLLPRCQVMSRRKDRRKKIFVPLLPGYVFVHTDLNAAEHLDILKTVGVVRMLAFEGKPIPASDEEISSLMILDGTDRTVQNQSFMRRGDKIMIMEGPFKGLVGFYVRHKGKSDKVVVSINLLNRALAIEIENWALERVS